MKILVLLKQTFDTEESILIENGEISEEGVKFIINPYDEYAVEEAVTLKEEHGGEVTAISLGPDRVQEALRTSLAMGVDKAIHINDEELFGDELKIAKVLAAVIKDQEFDIILGGYMAVDDGSAQVGPRVAEELDIPHLSTVVNLKIEDNKAIVDRDVEGNTEKIEVELPVLITAQQGLNEPRYPALTSIMKAKRKPYVEIEEDDIQLPEGLASKTELVEQFLPPKKEGGKILEGEITNQVKEVVQLLKIKEKVV
ncbi:electron transfer flavoprotein subunit beta/FixA family protein [Alkalihalobacillus sp. BA299]|uniref:electron transfer flavoprotein subunit beta/FixA family protein n=1 Tax=Alkalihalobacillus sp. BA299 TaxID=2815938 RepID=UPI001ADB362F|nr:electron transfer flavoprotein subunit beta/FixA family protein [Alkalihalobacillus sp. BA299]